MISYQNSKRVLKKAAIKIKNETILSINSLNRISSSNIYSKFNYPSGDNAAFDGYAINSKDTKNLDKNKSKAFKIVGSIAAGRQPFKRLSSSSNRSNYFKCFRFIFIKIFSIF